MAETLSFPIETKSLLLRPYEERDFDAFADLVGREDVTRYLFWGPRDRVLARETFDRRMKDLAPGDDARHLPLAIIERATGRFAGECSLINLDPTHRGCELGYMLNPDFHGRGLAVEAAREMLRIGFDILAMHRISASCDDRNAASARVMEKLGMRKEGHFRSNEWVKGEWIGGLYYAVLEDEWRAMAR